MASSNTGTDVRRKLAAVHAKMRGVSETEALVALGVATEWFESAPTRTDVVQSIEIDLNRPEEGTGREESVLTRTA